MAASNGLILFVGTKRQAADTIIDQCNRSGMPYVTERWLGGTLTDFRTIRSRLHRLEELESILDGEQGISYSKKMISTLSRERRKIKRNLRGIRHMNRLPEALLVIDPRREHIAVAEARKLGIKVVALLDTDCDPDAIDLPIPGNDDSMRSIELLLSRLTEAILEGKAAAPVEPPPPADGGSGRGDRDRDRRQGPPRGEGTRGPVKVARRKLQSPSRRPRRKQRWSPSAIAGRVGQPNRRHRAATLAATMKRPSPPKASEPAAAAIRCRRTQTGVPIDRIRARRLPREGVPSSFRTSKTSRIDGSLPRATAIDTSNKPGKIYCNRRFPFAIAQVATHPARERGVCRWTRSRLRLSTNSARRPAGPRLGCKALLKESNEDMTKAKTLAKSKA